MYQSRRNVFQSWASHTIILNIKIYIKISTHWPTSSLKVDSLDAFELLFNHLSKKGTVALARWLSWLKHHPMCQKVAINVPRLQVQSSSGCWQEATYTCFSLTMMFLSPSLSFSLSLSHLPFLSLKSTHIISGEDLKIKKETYSVSSRLYKTVNTVY